MDELGSERGDHDAIVGAQLEPRNAQLNAFFSAPLPRQFAQA